MKKLLLTTAFALSCIGVSAQQTLTLSTYKGTDLEKYAGQTLNVSISRYLFNQWNTLSLPFAMSAEQVDEVFGSDCKLEKLVGVENDGLNVKLNFQNCKKEGIKPNTPYILYYAGESGSKKFVVENAQIIKGTPQLVYTAEGSGETVIMSGAQTHLDSEGLYGILAKNNGEAAFVNVDEATNGFYATRCYVKMSKGNSTLLKTNHIDEDVTGVTSIVKKGERVDVYNLSGMTVAKQVTVDDIQRMQKGTYVTKGKTFLIK
ncbi:MAG: hypothetical protein GXY64_07215 [Bacteroidales bacterium]|nr:hypothetical protein [Bacteroidales bacterium]